MVGDDTTSQLETISHAVNSGIDYFDTAATYGVGRSEFALGAALETLGLKDRVRIATNSVSGSIKVDDVHPPCSLIDPALCNSSWVIIEHGLSVIVTLS